MFARLCNSKRYKTCENQKPKVLISLCDATTIILTLLLVQLLMDDQSFQISVGLRFGCVLCRTFRWICELWTDRSWKSITITILHKRHFFRHAEINNMLESELAGINTPAQLEPSGLDSNDGKRPDGITTSIIPWTVGQCLVWDFTRVDIFAAKLHSQTKEDAGTSAELVVKRKHAKYS